MLKRRTVIQGAGAALMSSLLATRTGFASAPTDNRLVVIILRGALDGLHALAPYADADYRRLRPRLALGRDGDPGLIDLDGYFGLHPALAPWHDLYQAGELLLVPAAATDYSDRSHFDGQNMLENGSGRPYGARDGWLNRALLHLVDGDRRLGLALGPSVPLILQGSAGVQTWAQTRLAEIDDDFLMRVGLMYQNDALFLDAFHDATGALKPDIDTSMMKGRGNGKEFSLAAQAAADLLSRADGPRVAVMQSQGWDTHFDQERRLSALLAELASGIGTLKTGLGGHWQRTVVMVVSEFGRTAAENGQRGTDHGTGGLAMLAGGAVRGGRIAGQWPGLSERALHEGRDVLAVNRYESIFKSIMIGHMGIAQQVVEDMILPRTANLAPMDGLLRG